MRDQIEDNYRFVRMMNGYPVRLSAEAQRPNAYTDATTFQVEKSDTVLDALKAFLPAHWQEAGRDHHAVPMDVAWTDYLQKEKNGQVMVVTGRDQEKLVAYHVFWIVFHPNYQTTKTCFGNVYYVIPSHRGRGYLGKMIEVAEVEARKLGVVRMVNRCKPDGPTKSFVSKGYALVDLAYEKLLTE